MVGNRRKKRTIRGRAGKRKPFTARPLAYALFYVTLAAAVTSLIAYSYRTLRQHPTFAVDNLLIEGGSEKTRTDLQRDLAWVLGRNFFTVDLARIRDQAVDHTWVEDAAVKGLLPRTVSILIQERQPGGLMRIGDEIIVLGEDAEPIVDYNAYPTVVDKPVLVGLDAFPQRKPVLERGLGTLNLIKDTSLYFYSQIETLDLSDDQNMIVTLRQVKAPLYLGPKVIPQNIGNYLSIAEKLHREHPNLKYIELGFPQQIAILPEEVDTNHGKN